MFYFICKGSIKKVKESLQPEGRNSNQEYFRFKGDCYFDLWYYLNLIDVSQSVFFSFWATNYRNDYFFFSVVEKHINNLSNKCSGWVNFGIVFVWSQYWTKNNRLWLAPKPSLWEDIYLDPTKKILIQPLTI